ncbi:MAG: hypothetical protein EON53_10095 [Actinomycetales bacterium]|uniref:hypothetical protein n=1 Tax=unclassified Aeromicrobium TaxID=2633570 RepID=UPI0010D68BBB|nr:MULTISPECIES: hypothetical protein [unclassified Aeromicrobium]RYY45771.1 MAG: hypothetical protein EON53_10095 [Actinomycetales bacterium]
MNEDLRAALKDQRMVVFGDTLPRKARNLGLELLPIDRSAQYEIQDGTALANVVYVSHPVRKDVLVAFADYDEQVARDKLQEALRVLNSLGAAEVVAREERTETSVSSLNVPIKKLNFGLRRSSTVQRKVAYEQRGTGSSPVDPRPLRYPGEPGFESACDAVLVNGARTIRIEIIRESQFSLDGEIALALKKAGLNLGASVQKSELRTFLVEAAFKGAALEKQVEKDSPEPSKPKRQGAKRLGGR